MTKQEFLAMSLPYKLIMYYGENYPCVELLPMHFDCKVRLLNDCGKPILHPLTDLTKPIKQNGEVFVPILKLGWSYSIIGWSKSNIIAATKNLTLTDALKLISWHFDIAGLIEKGEAIDVNTLETNPYK